MTIEEARHSYEAREAAFQALIARIHHIRQRLPAIKARIPDADEMERQTLKAEREALQIETPALLEDIAESGRLLCLDHLEWLDMTRQEALNRVAQQEAALQPIEARLQTLRQAVHAVESSKMRRELKEAEWLEYQREEYLPQARELEAEFLATQKLLTTARTQADVASIQAANIYGAELSARGLWRQVAHSFGERQRQEAEAQLTGVPLRQRPLARAGGQR